MDANKAILGLGAFVITGLLGWVVVTLNQQQLQWVRVEERLGNQNLLLIEVKKDVANWNTQIRLLENRVITLEQGRRYESKDH